MEASSVVPLCFSAAAVGAILGYTFGQDLGFGRILTFEKSVSTGGWNTAVLCAAAGLLGLVAGMVAGSELRDVGFSLHQWQPLIGAMVALMAAAIAFAMTWQTQRISIYVNRLEKIDRVLPAMKDNQYTLNMATEILRRKADSFEDLWWSVLAQFNPLDRPLGDDRFFDDVFATLDSDSKSLIRPAINVLVWHARTIKAKLEIGKSQVSETEFHPKLQDGLRILVSSGQSLSTQIDELSRERARIQKHLDRYFAKG